MLFYHHGGRADRYFPLHRLDPTGLIVLMDVPDGTVLLVVTLLFGATYLYHTTSAPIHS